MSSEDSSNIGSRMRRYANVSTKLTSIAARLAGHHYLGMNLSRDQHAKDLKDALGSLKGPLMKIAQLLSTIPDALPPEYMSELSQLQAQAPPMGWPFVKRRMNAELGHDWEKKFTTFEHTAAAAASLGQVHKGIDLDGNLVACKLQYPDMQSVVEADLKQLKIILKLFDSYDQAIQSDEIHKEISARLWEELDYGRELKHINLFQAILAQEPGIHVPYVVSDLCTSRLLTMEWLEGVPLLQARDRPLTSRNEIARNMFRAWYVPFYNYGIIHGDPHLGNYSVREDNTINLLDFGCVRVFPVKFVKGVIDLYFAMARNDRELAVEAYRSWGFENLSNDLIDVLNHWAALT